MNLRYDNKPIAFVIAYYGSFVDEDTYNIILEYADRGNFEEFMKTTPEPSTSESMIELWERLSRISHGLAHIHGTPGTTSTGAPLLGYVISTSFMACRLNIIKLDGIKTSNLQTYLSSVEVEHRAMTFTSNLPT